jgi:hypothetical protein
MSNQTELIRYAINHRLLADPDAKQ